MPVDQHSRARCDIEHSLIRRAPFIPFETDLAAKLAAHQRKHQMRHKAFGLPLTTQEDDELAALCKSVVGMTSQAARRRRR